MIVPFLPASRVEAGWMVNLFKLKRICLISKDCFIATRGGGDRFIKYVNQ